MLTITVQLPSTGMEPPVNVTEFEALVTVPLHCEALGTLARVMPVGKVSVKLTPVSGTVLSDGFVRVKVNAEVPPAAMGLGEKVLLMAGGAITVSSSQAAVRLVASWLSVSVLAGIQF